jgi:flagellar hook assembly protein FlgD
VAFAVTTPRDVSGSVEVLDTAGRRVATVLHGTLSAGEHSLRWDGIASDGRAAAPGVYRIRLMAGGTSLTRAFTLLR